MHRISDPKLSGTSKRNFALFRTLCGDKTLRNVVVVTNMWSLVDAAVGERRERELATDEVLFKPVLDKGAVMMRHTYACAQTQKESAHAILQRFVENHPEALAIQTEVVQEGRGVDSTSAGMQLQEEMNRELEATKQRQEGELRRAQEVIAEAVREQEARQAAEIERARREMEEEMKRAREAHEREMRRQAEESRQAEEQRQELERAREAARAELERIQGERRRLQEEAERIAREAAAESARMHEEMQRLENERSNGGCAIF